MTSYIKLFKPEVFNKELSITELVIISHIIHLSRWKKYCYANNKALADTVGCSEETVKRTIKGLKDKNIIYTRVPNQGRRIFLHEEYLYLLVTEDNTTQDKDQ